jgi:hypothetical protein
MTRCPIIILTIIVLLLTAAATPALDLGVGIKGGVNLSNYLGNDTGSGNDMKLGYVGGLFGTVSVFSALALQQELLISLKGTRAEFSNMVVREHLTYVEMPLMIKYYPPIPIAKINLFTGPYVAFTLRAKYREDSNSTDIKDMVEPVDYGLVFGTGVDLEKVTIDGRYTLGLKKLSTNGSDIKNSVLSLQIGYRFK